MIEATIDEYFCTEFSNESPELSVPEIVRGLSEFIVGMTGVNVSWDSGRLQPSEDQTALGWRVVNGYALTPVIDEELAGNWPCSACSGYDEWYFFRSVPSNIEIEAFCNWQTVSLKEWELVSFKCDLREQLRRYQPDIVLGDGWRVFVIARDRRVVDKFKSLAHESEP